MMLNHRWKCNLIQLMVSVLCSLVCASTAIVSANQCAGQWRFPTGCKGSQCQYVAQYKYDAARQLVDFVISTNRPDKWVGIGFSNDKQMANTDIVVAWVEPGGRYVMMDAWLESYSAPVPDIKQSIANISASANNGLISFLFSRAVNTDDTAHDLSFSDCLYLVYPVGGGPVNIQGRNIRKHHQTPVFSDEKICLTSCASSANNKEAHAAKPKAKPESGLRNQTDPKAIEPPTVKESHKNVEGHSVSDQINNNENVNKDTAIQADVTRLQNPTASTTASTLSTSTTTTTTTELPPTEEPLVYSNCKGEWKYPSRCTGYGCDYKVNWEYVDDADEIMFIVSTKNRHKWTGIGFSTDRSMPGTDAVLGLVEESGRFFLMDTWLRGYQAPPLDPIQNIQNQSVWRENGVTTLQFNRKRRTGDKNDFQFSDTSCPYFVFPVQGGVFNAVNKRLRKHEVTPIVSDMRICVRSCRPKVSTTTATIPTTSTSTTTTFTTTTTTTTSTTAAPSSPLPGGKPGHDIDLAALGFSPENGFPDLSSIPNNGQLPDISQLNHTQLTTFLQSMNISGSDLPTLMRTLAKFPQQHHAKNESSHSNPKTNGQPTLPKQEASTPAAASPTADRKKTTPKANQPTNRVRTTQRKTTTSTTTTTTTTPSTSTTSSSAAPTTSIDNQDDVPTTELPVTTKTAFESVGVESNYIIELKLPRAWKTAYGRPQSAEYVAFSKTVEDEVRRELEEKIESKGVDVSVMELTGVDDLKGKKGENSVLAKLKLVLKNKASNNNSKKTSDDDQLNIDEQQSAPINVTSALNSAIEDGRIGDVPVDASYLVVRPLSTQQPTDSEAKDATILTDEQLKWLVIVGGVAALVILVVIQASCMVWRDKRNHERHLSKVALTNGQVPHLNGKGQPGGGPPMAAGEKQMHPANWKDYPPSINGGYSYENFGEEIDGSATLQGTHKKQRRSNGYNGKHYGDKGPNGYGAGEGMPLPSPPMRPPGHHDRPSRDGRGGGHYAQPHALQPDFYFMPHQRRYSGEVVRVFVDYNNPQYVPK